MKIRIILLLVIVIISLSACADVTVSFNLSNDNSLNINYSLSVSSDEDISGDISAIKTYWTDMGFSADDSEKNGVFSLNGYKTINCDTRGSAVNELSSILTDEDSLFYNVKFTYTPSYFEDIYDLSADISLKDIIRKSEKSNIPSAEIESFLKDADKGNYKLSITLPGEVQETNANERNGQTCTWLLKYGETRELKLLTKREFEENKAHYDNLKENQSRDNLLLTVCCAASVFLLLLTIIIAAVRSAKSKRTTRSEIRVERF